MKKASSVRLGLKAWLNPVGFNLERWVFTFHRITGVILVLYLYLHIAVVGSRLDRSAFEGLMAAFKNPVNHLFEAIVLASMIFHGLNGIRLILAELGFIIGKPKRPIYPYKTALDTLQRKLLLLLMAVGVIIFAIGAIEYILPIGG